MWTPTDIRTHKTPIKRLTAIWKINWSLCPHAHTPTLWALFMWHVCEINLERLLDLVFVKGLTAVNKLVEGGHQSILLHYTGRIAASFS